MDLTGAQIETVLEQQWQRDADGNVPSRPFLRLGTSKGFTYTTTPPAPRATGSRACGSTGADRRGRDLHGRRELASSPALVTTSGRSTPGTDKQDTGVTDLQARSTTSRRTPPAAGRLRPARCGRPVPGRTVLGRSDCHLRRRLLSMTGEGDLTDSTMAIALGRMTLGTFAVTTDLPTTPYDIPGAGTVTFILPPACRGHPAGHPHRWHHGHGRDGPGRRGRPPRRLQWSGNCRRHPVWVRPARSP